MVQKSAAPGDGAGGEDGVPVRQLEEDQLIGILIVLAGVLAQLELSLIDHGAIALYAAVVIGLDAWFAREQRSSTDYLLVGRSMGWITVGISQLASLLSAISYRGKRIGTI